MSDSQNSVHIDGSVANSEANGDNNEKRGKIDAIDGYIIVNSVSHARYLPKPSTHAFNYPTVSVFVNVRSLYSSSVSPNAGGSKDTINGNENTANGDSGFMQQSTTRRRSIGFSGLIFGTGSSAKRRLMNLRPSSYLFDDGNESTTLLERFDSFVASSLTRPSDVDPETIMTQENVGSVRADELRDVWLLTSPSYCGIEGINPLSVWFAYDQEKKLRVVLLEVCLRL